MTVEIVDLETGGFDMSERPTRVERDLLGEKRIPADAYYGVQTARALENFHISGVPCASTPT